MVTAARTTACKTRRSTPSISGTIFSCVTVSFVMCWMASCLCSSSENIREFHTRGQAGLQLSIILHCTKGGDRIASIALEQLRQDAPFNNDVRTAADGNARLLQAILENIIGPADQAMRAALRARATSLTAVPHGEAPQRTGGQLKAPEQTHEEKPDLAQLTNGTDAVVSCHVAID